MTVPASVRRVLRAITVEHAATSTRERIRPGQLPEFAAIEADRLYEALQAAENAAARLAEALAWMGAYGHENASKRRSAARRLHRRVFALLEAAEDAYHANDGHLAAREAAW